ncbi:MAG: hypothetical protein P4L95_03180 [Rouxiella aceris]|uniref:hypothetical protein n=1 Tax=Rouxiella aceris TaxID=2703884 RepID=UPI002846A149|nr:hypothetical protein [Rouxiella aceris]MDR3430904.1 hypothetical protein [Rouxiella aceris]
MEIHRAVRQRFNVQWRQCDRYIALAIGTRTGSDTRLPRVRAGHQHLLTSEMLEKIRFLYGDGGK